MAINEVIYDDSTLIATKMLDITSKRQKVIANNIANASTPGFIRKELDFQKKLAEQVESGDMRNVESVDPTVVDDLTDAPKMDGNNVNVSTELVQLMQNGVLSSLLGRAYTTKMNILRNSMKSQS